MDEFCGAPIFISTDRIPTCREDIETHFVEFLPGYRHEYELQLIRCSKSCYETARRSVGSRKPAFVYQRYSVFNYAGLQLAREYRVPFVLEYNGSELWIARNWGEKAFQREECGNVVEEANLKSADVVVVVSNVMKDELIERGIDEDAILVNPNGVDTEIYSPEVNGSAIRSQYQLEDEVVIGFIGTFGAWHGAEVLAEAFGKLLQQSPELRGSVRLMLIGDGKKMTEVKQALAATGAEGDCILPGRIPQAEGPKYLAACDLLASPHVPNADGSRFFGSPTKLFEYMAMGKGIVASDLDQIGEVLRHDETAWMTKPGDVDSLVEGLRVMIDSTELRERLGANARRDAIANYSWREHTRRIIEKLRERVR